MDAAPVTNDAYGIVVAGAAFFVVAILGVLTAGRMTFAVRRIYNVNSWDMR